MSAQKRPSVPSTSASSVITEPTFPQLLRFTLPMLWLMLCHLGISLTDLWVAGKLNTVILASLGIISQIFIVMMLVTSLAGGGALAAISQSLGAGKSLRASRYAGLILMLGLGAGASVGLGVFLITPVVFRLFPVEEDIAPIIETFINAYCLQLPLYYCLTLSNSIFRAYTMVWRPFIAFSIVLIVNFIGSTGFGLGWWNLPEYGYAGIAWSTALATLCGMALNMAICFRKKILCRQSFAPWRWNKKALPYIFRVGVPTALSQLASQGASIFMLSLIAMLPGSVSPILAGYTLGLRVSSLALFPLGALSLSMAIISGHLLGGNKQDKLYTFGLKTAYKGMTVLSLLGLFLWHYKFELSNFFSRDMDVIVISSLYVTFVSLALPFIGFSAIITGIYSGAGATHYSGVIQIGVAWCIRLPLAWLLACIWGLNELGIFIAFPVSSALEAMLNFFVYRRRAWFNCGLRARRHKDDQKRPRMREAPQTVTVKSC